MTGRRHFLVLTGAGGVSDALAAASRARLQDFDDCAALPRRLGATAVEIGFLGSAPERDAFDAVLLVVPDEPLDAID